MSDLPFLLFTPTTYFRSVVFYLNSSPIPRAIAKTLVTRPILVNWRLNYGWKEPRLNSHPYAAPLDLKSTNHSNKNETITEQTSLVVSCAVPGCWALILILIIDWIFFHRWSGSVNCLGLSLFFYSYWWNSTFHEGTCPVRNKWLKKSTLLNWL